MHMHSFAPHLVGPIGVGEEEEAGEHGAPHHGEGVQGVQLRIGQLLALRQPAHTTAPITSVIQGNLLD